MTSRVHHDGRQDSRQDLRDKERRVPTSSLDRALIELLRTTLPEVAEHTVAAVRDEVPAYGEGLGDQLAATIEQAVQMALAGFLRVAGRTGDPGTPLSPTLEGAYAAKVCAGFVREAAEVYERRGVLRKD